MCMNPINDLPRMLPYWVFGPSEFLPTVNRVVNVDSSMVVFRWSRRGREDSRLNQVS